ncbi:MAG: KOW domain-containing RNA-binding protein [Thermoanaerobacteraceae bacterium]|nr:KOW domain-containing RNA-binding protein [Thermoanaerobacteraceae bacterium]
MVGMPIGRIVRSKAGRDKDRVFVVIAEVDDKHVLIADGDLRKIEKPKKKKIIHLQKYNAVAENVREKLLNKKTVTNSDLIEALKQYKESN